MILQLQHHRELQQEHRGQEDEQRPPMRVRGLWLMLARWHRT
jgi:hypothetical protein